jgi:hypothetical protein
MIWLSIVSLSVGALLAQRFKFAVLVPVTLTVLATAIGAGVARAGSTWFMIGMIAAASVSIQVGYFVGVLIQHGLSALLAGRSAAFSHTASTRDAVR